MGRAAMSGKELRRAGILARVESGELKLVNAAVMMGVSYRLSHAIVNLSHSPAFVESVWSGATEGPRFGPPNPPPLTIVR